MKKLLVANRGEIACRIFQTCRELGLRSVALVAPGDENGRHVGLADEVIEVPSYLDAKAIVDAARLAQVNLIHPGYGFLSERSHFVTEVEKSKIIWIGPRAETMDALGDKIGSKKLAEKSIVPTLPWALVPSNASEADLKKEAARIGYPLLLKASSGGGGKGMRRVDQEADLASAAESASGEAKSAFGDGTLFLEKLLENPRHIEVQVLGDGEGGGIHLYERECSIQRRHQKIWEESRAPNLSETTRKGLYDSAMKLIQTTKYRSAGTVEFLVDSKGGFYFLEMNTRLQVEHPVTENVTGIDLVAAQIELALTGKSSWITQGTPQPRGASIEVRLYAENPDKGFVPSPGTVMKLRWPTGVGIRVDSGIEEGQEITSSFDPMLAKLIVWAPTREHAIARMAYALDETVVLGLQHNLDFLRFLCTHPSVQKGQMNTQMIEGLLKDYREWDLTPEVLDALKASLRSSQRISGGAEFLNPWEKFSGSLK